MQQKPDNQPTKEPLGVRIKSDFEKFYNLKGWCDALDYSGVWRLGRIKKADGINIPNNISYFEKIIIYSFILTAGVKSGNKYCSCPRPMSYNVISGILKLLLHDDKLSGFDAFKLTSFVRGDLFVLIDSVLTLNDRREAQECHQISSFMKHYINMALKWMNLAVPTYQSTRKELGIEDVDYMEEIKNKKLHVISKDISLYMCGIEIFISLRSIFGFEARSSTFYEKNTLTLNSKDLINHFLSNQGLNKLNELLAYEDKEIPEGRIDFRILWPLIYSVPFFFTTNKIVWTPWSQPIQKFIETMYTRLKKEFELDRQFRHKFEKNEFVEFIHALEKLNSYVNEGGFLLDTLFSNELDLEVEEEGEEEDEGHHTNRERESLKSLNDIIYGRGRDRETTVVHQNEDAGWKKASEDSIVIDEDLVPKNGTKEGTQTVQRLTLGQDNQEVNMLKENILNMQKQMLELKKGLDSMIKDQNEQRVNVAKVIEEKAELKKKLAQPKNEPQELRSEFLDSLRKSGITPQELGTYMGYIKQINQTLKNEKKSNLIGKAQRFSMGFEEYRGNENKHEEAGFGTEEDELKVLTALEMNLANNKLADALKLIKWRKKVIKLAHMNGWDIASIIANKTASKQDIDAADILMSNINFLQRKEIVASPAPSGNQDIVCERYEPSEKAAGDGDDEEDEYYGDDVESRRKTITIRESYSPVTPMTDRYTEITSGIKEEPVEIESENMANE